MTQTCDYIEAAGSTVESIAYVVLANPGEGQCFNIDYDDIIENNRRTEWDAPAVVAGYRQWTYMLCSVRSCYDFTFSKLVFICSPKLSSKSDGSIHRHLQTNHSETISEYIFIMKVVKQLSAKGLHKNSSCDH